MTFDKNLYSETKFVLLDTEIALPSSFVIITAENPFHRNETTKLDNILRNNKLERELSALNFNFSKTVGCSSDLKHCELSYLISTNDTELVLDLGVKYEQESIFIVIDNILYVSDCHIKHRKLTKIGLFADKIVHCN